MNPQTAQWLWFSVYIVAAFIGGFAIGNWITNEFWTDAAYHKELRVIKTKTYRVQEIPKRII